MKEIKNDEFYNNISEEMKIYNKNVFKEIRLLKSKSGHYIQKGLKRLYLDDKQKPDKFELGDALKLMSS